jgi:hypothetical protein
MPDARRAVGRPPRGTRTRESGVLLSDSVSLCVLVKVVIFQI